MKQTPDQLPQKPSSAIEDRPCVMTVYFEDSMARNRAAHLCHRLSHEKQEHLPLAISWWNFNCLEDPLLAQDATNAAAHADVILVATTSQAPLPQLVADSIKRCVCLRVKPEGLLVALVHDVGNNSPLEHPVIRTLKLLIHNKALDFLHETRRVEADSHEEIVTKIHHRAHADSRMLQESMLPHWQTPH